MKKIISMILSVVMTACALTALTAFAADYTIGDVDGDGSINGKDANVLKRYIAGALVLDDQRAADINEDGVINGTDSNLLMQYLAGDYVIGGGGSGEGGDVEVTGPAFIVDTVSASAGDTEVAVTVAVKNNPNIASIGMLVEFDDALTLTSISYNTSIGGQSMAPETLASPAKLTWVSPFANVSGDFTFATLYFTVADDASGSLPVTVSYDENDVYDMTETNIEFEVVNGAVNVK